MRSLLLVVLACYLVAAIHSLLAFVNKRRSMQQVSETSVWIGFGLHTIALGAGWVIDGRYPLFSLRETLSFLGWTMVAAYGLALYRYRAHALGAFMLPITTVLTFAAIVMRADEGGVPDPLAGASGKWLFPFHTTVLIFAYASFFVVFVASIMYLWQERELKSKSFGAFFHRLPSLTTVNDIATVAATIGLTLLTLGIAAGMVWSSAKYGRVWHNDPKEILAALTWLLYLGLIVYRSTARWRGRRAAWLGVAGFALVLCTFLGARMMGGYHVFG
jgi:ABC-type transport system involved in cytochrome c biogenesis permease subunit